MSKTAEEMVLSRLGIDIDAIVAAKVEAALGGAAVVAARPARNLQVTILEGKQRDKFGDVQVSVKPEGGNRFIPKVTLKAGELPFVIDELTAALEALNS